MRKAPGSTLSSTTDIVANKISLIQGNTTTDILDLIGNAVGNVDAYTRTESDARYYTQSQVNTALALKVDSTTLTNKYMPTAQINSAQRQWIIAKLEYNEAQQKILYFQVFQRL